MKAALRLAVMAAALLTGCAGAGAEEGPSAGESQPSPREVANQRAARELEPSRALKSDCTAGERPDYYVPGPRAAVIGCAEVGVSGKPVEFSVQNLPGPKDGLCLNPAYTGRGQPGIYIPAVCQFEQPLSGRLSIWDASVPRQAVRGYRLVLWGTASGSTREVIVQYDGERAQAAVLRARPSMTEAVSLERPFNVFVVELPREVAQRPAAASCEDIVLRAPGAPNEVVRVKARPRLCGRRSE